MNFQKITAIVVLFFINPVFSQTIPNSSIQGYWILNEMTCLNTNAKYSAKGWTIKIDSLYFSSQITARCEISYSLPYIANSKFIQLQAGVANQKCNVTSSTIISNPVNLTYSLGPRNILTIDTFNSYCGNLARYVFIRTQINR